MPDVENEKTNAKAMLSEAEAAPYRDNASFPTARAFNPATGAMASSASLKANLIPGKEMLYGGFPGENQRVDALFTVETADGKTYRRILARGDVSPKDGLKITRIVPFPNGWFALLLHESTMRENQPFSAILIVDADGTPLQQTWSAGGLYIEDLTMTDNGDQSAVGYTADKDTKHAVLQRYRATRF